MKNKTSYKSLQDIRISRERLRYKSRLLEEKMKNKGHRVLSDFSVWISNLKFNIRNRLISYSFFRVLTKSGFMLSFARNFVKGFRRAR